MLFASILLHGCGCHNEQKENNWKPYSQDKVLSIINNRIIMPDSIPVCYPDSAAFDAIMAQPFKIIFNVDISCSTCLAKFGYWNEFANNLKEKHNLEVPVLAVITSPDFNDDIHDFILTKWSQPWIFDPEADFTYLNDIEDDRFQAVLLDSEGKVRLVGNPMFNKALGRLYEKTVVEMCR
jgi:hypothetical protein